MHIGICLFIIKWLLISGDFVTFLSFWTLGGHAGQTLTDALIFVFQDSTNDDHILMDICIGYSPNINIGAHRSGELFCEPKY